jgi:hypothetical protein
MADSKKEYSAEAQIGLGLSNRIVSAKIRVMASMSPDYLLIERDSFKYLATYLEELDGFVSDKFLGMTFVIVEGANYEFGFGSKP